MRIVGFMMMIVGVCILTLPFWGGWLLNRTAGDEPIQDSYLIEIDARAVAMCILLIGGGFAIARRKHQ